MSDDQRISTLIRLRRELLSQYRLEKESINVVKIQGLLASIDDMIGRLCQESFDEVVFDKLLELCKNKCGTVYN